MSKSRTPDPVATDRVGTVSIDAFGRLWTITVYCVWYTEYHPDVFDLSFYDLEADDYRFVVATKYGPVGVNVPIVIASVAGVPASMSRNGKSVEPKRWLADMLRASGYANVTPGAAL